ncbi:hypothetical protein [Dokdonella soli]|uniref:Uncharacterized protein n=1 Tax=Dokdonella soli TaxID=529810 RepID=A0ABN1IVK9_9GAMM
MPRTRAIGAPFIAQTRWRNLSGRSLGAMVPAESWIAALRPGWENSRIGMVRDGVEEAAP